MAKIGVIGGSGLYNIEGLQIIEEKEITTPFGMPSSSIVIGKLEGKEIAFLPRHGVGHTIMPSEINYRANIYAMKMLEVTSLLSFSACGSFKEELKPKDIVLIDQFFDRTNQARKTTFFGEGIVAHIAFAEPICPYLRMLVYGTAKQENLIVHDKGIYLNMEGPAFSTRAESLVYKSWGMDVIGMTNMAEARLAREAEICYCSVCFVTDYDAWKSDEHVSIDKIIENFSNNVENAKRLLKAVVPKITDVSGCTCREALKNAIITNKDNMSSKAKTRIGYILKKYEDKLI
ncbi:MAG: S-methyl-5'-thioadenosine phosphorylase [Candidatus Omnitrophica bacterium]|nr:S-methyl-5'-thioadenosine phosphorylase [Candidatus Omnitrophota bacterium]